MPAIEAARLRGRRPDRRLSPARRARSAAEAIIVSRRRSKDLDGVGGRRRHSMYDPMKGVRIEREQVFEKLGVYPRQGRRRSPALCGDESVDNVHWSPGDWRQDRRPAGSRNTAISTRCWPAPARSSSPSARETLIEFADQIRLSRALVKLDCDTPLPEPIDDLKVREPDKEVLAAFPRADGVPHPGPPGRGLCSLGRGGAPERLAKKWGIARPHSPRPCLDRLVYGRGRRAAAPVAGEPIAVDHAAYVRIQDIETLKAWVAKATAKGVIAFDTETDALSSATAELCGVSLAIAPGEACYIPVGHCEKDGLALEAAADLVQIPLAEVITALKPLLEDPAVLKVAQNAEYDIAVLSRYGIQVAPIEDTMLISYVLEAGLHGHGMDELSELWLGHKPIPFKQVAGTGKAQISFKHVGLTEATAYAAEDADVTLRLYETLKPRLARRAC
ncbi:hypothetical protein ACRAWD_12190 [Caulobacter segnis]